MPSKSADLLASPVRSSWDSGARVRRPLLTVRPWVARSGPRLVTMAPMPSGEFERVEIFESLAMTLAHLTIAEERREMSPRVPLLMAIRDKLAAALREDP